jgi:hypothetical protein
MEAAMAEPPLDLTAIVKLAARGQAACYDSEEALRPTPRQALRLRSAELAIVAAARLASHLDAVGLVGELRRWAKASPLAEDPMSIERELVDALLVAVHDGFDRERLASMLAELDDGCVAEVAKALDPEQAADLELLLTLAEDPRTTVAAAAWRCLGPRRRWCWHAGIFDEDPLAAADTPAIVDALGKARAALGRERPDARPTSADALCSAVAELPAVLAIPLLEAGVVVFASGLMARIESPELGQDPVARLYALGGVDAVVRALGRVVEAHGDPEPGFMRVSPWCCSLPEPGRVELVHRLLAWIADPAAHTHARVQAAGRLIAAVWPPSVSPLPLLEWLVGFEHSSTTGMLIACRRIEQAIEQSSAELERDAERLVELLLAHPRLLRDLSKLFARLAETVTSTRLDQLSQRAAGSQHASVRAWALELRSGRLAPSDTTERDALATAWLDDPATRELLSSSPTCRARLLPWLRRRLRAGELTLPEANAVMLSIGDLYGGVASAHAERMPRKPSELEAAEQRAQARAALGVWLDPPNGPPSLQEWTQLRALARAWIEQRKGPSWQAVVVRPVGPMSAEDLALREAIGIASRFDEAPRLPTSDARAKPPTPIDWMDEDDEELDP